MDAFLAMVRADARYAEFVKANYWDEDTLAAAERFMSSAEFQEVLEQLSHLWPATILDLGSGTGIAAYAFSRSGAKHVYALEPDSSPYVGRRAIERITRSLPCTVVSSTGEQIPLPDGSVDAVYARQVLHHAENLQSMLSECSRVLREGGVMLACREPTVKNALERRRLLARHSVHRYLQNENAFKLEEYLEAFSGGGLVVTRLFGPTEGSINLYPRSEKAPSPDQAAADALARRLGRLGGNLAKIPLCVNLVRVLKRHIHPPGPLYTFVATKPRASHPPVSRVLRIAASIQPD